MSRSLHELQNLVRSEAAHAPRYADPFFRRLALALPGRCQPCEASAADLAALIRQAMLRADMPASASRELVVPGGPGWPDEALWQQRFSCDTLSMREGYVRIRPRPWRPEWLDDGAGDVVDAAIREDNRRQQRKVPADPGLTEQFGWTEYFSAGQRAAVRAAFLTPPGSTTIVTLPTGGGKSLVFQLAARTWQPGGGLTLVIVPTIALARDQEARFRALPQMRPTHTVPASVPLAFHGGLDRAARAALHRALRAGEIPILFTSPEGALGSLRDTLFEVAKQGRLRVFAIDEAHLVAQWGEEFRPEFQSLTGLRDALLESCPAAARFRTLLLSATLTADVLDTLRVLFARDGEIVAELALRQEISFLLNAAPDEDLRSTRVSEAIDHLPRPLILYTTLREHAQLWFDHLRSSGYRRLRLVLGGDLTAASGAHMLEEWRRGEVDVVVATSAFGLGMDQSEIRSVVHACLPETIDRFYQEVGRAGRDGHAAVSLLVSAPEDAAVATQLAAKRRIGVEKGFERWRQMWHSGHAGPNGTRILLLDSSPPRITVPGERNESWNLRTLVLMARAGLIAFGVYLPAVPEDPGRKIAVRVRDENHLNQAQWDRVVSSMRTQLWAQDAKGAKLVTELLNLDRPLNELFREVYSLSDPISRPPYLAGSCPATRARGTASFMSAAPEVVSFSRTDVRASEDLVRALVPCTDDAGRSWIAYEPPAGGPLDMRQWRNSMLALLRQLVARGVLELSVPDGVLDSRGWQGLLDESAARFLVCGDAEDPEPALQLPRASLIGPVPRSDRVASIMRLHRPRHVIVAPRDTPDPSRPGRLFDRVRHLSAEEFLMRLTP